MKNDDSSQLESSKVFSRGHRLEHTVLKNPYPKSMKTYEIIENLCKSLKSQHSSKGFYRGSRLPLTVLKHPYPKSMKIYENRWKLQKPMNIYENLLKSMKSMDSSKGFYRGSRLPLRGLEHPWHQMHRKPSKTMKSMKSMKLDEKHGFEQRFL